MTMLMMGTRITRWVSVSVSQCMVCSIDDAIAHFAVYTRLFIVSR